MRTVCPRSYEARSVVTVSADRPAAGDGMVPVPVPVPPAPPAAAISAASSARYAYRPAGLLSRPLMRGMLIGGMAAAAAGGSSAAVSVPVPPLPLPLEPAVAEAPGADVRAESGDGGRGGRGGGWFGTASTAEAPAAAPSPPAPSPPMPPESNALIDSDETATMRNHHLESTCGSAAKCLGRTVSLTPPDSGNGKPSATTRSAIGTSSPVYDTRCMACPDPGSPPRTSTGPYR